MLFDEILTTIRAVHSGQRRIPEAVGTRLAERDSATALSSRELSRSWSCSRKDAATVRLPRILAITEATVKGHVANILSKLGVSNRTQAVITALKRGFVHL